LCYGFGNILRVFDIEEDDISLMGSNIIFLIEEYDLNFLDSNYFWWAGPITFDLSRASFKQEQILRRKQKNR